MPYLRQHPAEASQLLADSIVYQMWYGGQSFYQINKWLETMQLKTVKAYAVQDNQLKVWYKNPDRIARMGYRNVVVVE